MKFYLNKSILNDIIDNPAFNFRYKCNNSNEIIVKSPSDIICEVVFQQLTNARNTIDLIEVIKVE